MSPRYRFQPVEPVNLATKDRIQVRLRIPGATHVIEYVVTDNDPSAEVVYVVDAFKADSYPTALKYGEWLFERGEA